MGGDVGWEGLERDGCVVGVLIRVTGCVVATEDRQEALCVCVWGVTGKERYLEWNLAFGISPTWRSLLL